MFKILFWFWLGVIALVTESGCENMEGLFATSYPYGDYNTRNAYRGVERKNQSNANPEWPSYRENPNHQNNFRQNFEALNYRNDMDSHSNYNPFLKANPSQPMANAAIGSGYVKSDNQMNTLELSENEDFTSNSVFVPKSLSVKQNLGTCLKWTLPCNLIPAFTRTCQAYCAVQSIPSTSPLSPVLFSLGNVLKTTLKAMCNPLKTTFELGWQYFVEDNSAVFSFAQWQRRMGIDVRHVAYDQVQMLADYVFGQVVRYAETPLRVLRAAYEEVDVAVQAVQAGAELYKTYNPGCFGLAFQESANKFIDILYRHPNLLDVFLSGSLLVVNAGKHIPGSHQDLFNSVAIVSEAILGTSCGVLYWAGVRDAFCDQKAGIDSHSKLDIHEPYCTETEEVEVYLTVDE